MKRTALFALMISLLCTGCGRGAGDEDTIHRWQDAFAQRETNFSVSVTAQSTDTVFSYEADCDYADGATGVTLTAPENIAGVRYRTDGESSTLSYDGAELVLGDPGMDAIPPAMAVPLMLEAMGEGYLQRTWREGEHLVAELALEESVVTLWLAGETPVHAQIAVDGFVAQRLDIQQWQQKEA